MNAYNQENITMSDSKPLLVGAVNSYQSQGSDNTYTLLIKKYMSDVEELVVKILRQNKKMSENDANTFTDNMFSLGDQRQKDILKEVQACYDEGKTKRQCAHALVDKYYKITKVNKYQNQNSYQTDRNQGGEGEVTEVTEAVRDMMTPKPKEDLKKSLDKLPKSERLKKALDWGVYNNEEIVEILKSLPKNKRLKLFVESLEEKNYELSKLFVDAGVADDLSESDIVIISMKGYEEIANLLKQSKNPTKMERIKKFLGFQKKEEPVEEYTFESVNEKVKYEQFKKVAPSLFWNFIDRIRDLNIQFKLDTSYVKGVQNSLNTKGYVMYMETPKVNNTEVEYEFKHSRTLSNILGYIFEEESDDETSFYIGIDSTAQLHFGFSIDGKRYKIGYSVITSYDFQKLIPIISSDKDIDLFKLSRKFVSNIESLSAIQTKLSLYLDKYDDDIVIYNAIVNNNFGIVIESTDDEVVSQQYIEEIIRNNVKISHYSNWYVEKTKSNNKTFYYFILK